MNRFSPLPDSMDLIEDDDVSPTDIHTRDTLFIPTYKAEASHNERGSAITVLNSSTKKYKNIEKAFECIETKTRAKNLS